MYSSSLLDNRSLETGLNASKRFIVGQCALLASPDFSGSPQINIFCQIFENAQCILRLFIIVKSCNNFHIVFLFLFILCFKCFAHRI